MVAQPPIAAATEVTYPDSDGQPMADNTKQFRWIVTIKENLEILYANDPNVFVAGDLLWYPVEGNNALCQAPDVMVVLGRPKRDRGSYQQWNEENIAPQIVFEILSPSNTAREMTRKLLFYQQFGVEEYYLYDPENNGLLGSQQVEQKLVEIAEMQGWVSPRLGIRFVLAGDSLVIYNPDGRPFLTPVELAQQRDQAEQRANQAEQRADQAEQRAERLAIRLREMGIDPDAV
ncbi:MAG: Uma2 family endonuclease [Cyanobacteria bacterium P01_D01_bin.44]